MTESRGITRTLGAMLRNFVWQDMMIGAFHGKKS